MYRTYIPGSCSLISNHKVNAPEKAALLCWVDTCLCGAPTQTISRHRINKKLFLDSAGRDQAGVKTAVSHLADTHFSSATRSDPFYPNLRGERSARRWVRCDLGLLAVCPPLGNHGNEPVSMFTRLLASLSATVAHKLSVYRPACVAVPSTARGQRRGLGLRVAFLFLLPIPAKSDFSSLRGPVARRMTNHSGP